MAKMKMVQASKLPIARLVEENTDSQASAMSQAQLLRKRYMKDEKLEDRLKEYLKRTDPEAYKILCEIDKRQDAVINDVLYYAEHIRRINFLSNMLLKKFDVKQKTSPQKRGQTRNLFQFSKIIARRGRENETHDENLHRSGEANRKTRGGDFGRKAWREGKNNVGNRDSKKNARD